MVPKITATPSCCPTQVARQGIVLAGSHRAASGSLGQFRLGLLMALQPCVETGKDVSERLPALIKAAVE